MRDASVDARSCTCQRKLNSNRLCIFYCFPTDFEGNRSSCARYKNVTEGRMHADVFGNDHSIMDIQNGNRHPGILLLPGFLFMVHLFNAFSSCNTA